MTADLPAFLLARIGEDEAGVRAATPGPWRWEGDAFDGDPPYCPHGSEWTDHGPDLFGGVVGPSGYPESVISSGGYDASYLNITRPNAEHIARHDPARVLADCAAKRAIVELHRPYEKRTGWRDGRDVYEWLCRSCGGATPDTDPGGNLWLERWNEEAPCDTLRVLAQPFADHPDYDESWRP